MQSIQQMITNLDVVIGDSQRPHPDQYRPIDRPSLITAIFLLLDWEETGYVSRDAFRPIAAMLGMSVTTDEQWENTYMEFCGEYHVQPDVGIEVSWLKSWINDINGEGYISGSVLHNYLFGVKPKPSRSNRKPPTVTSHPPDVMVKPVTAVSTVSPPPTPRMVFPPVPPGLQQPSSSSSSTTPISPPPTWLHFRYPL